jgi:Tfp pilus assembly protein PilX
MNSRLSMQKGVSAMIALVLIVLFALLGTYMSTLSTIGSLNTTQSLGSMQAWFAARSGAEWAVHQALNRPVCTCGTDCCTAAPSISGATISFSASGAINGFQSTITGCGDAPYTEAGSSYCVYNVSVSATRGSPGDITYLSRNLNFSVTDGP